jgi:hypothetical protein
MHSLKITCKKNIFVKTEYHTFEGNTRDIVTVDCMHTNWEHTLSLYVPTNAPSLL